MERKTLRAGVLALGLLLGGACGDDDQGGGGDGGPAEGGTSSGSDCARGCNATLAADCPMGPPTREECESDCERLFAGDCGAQYRVLMTCANGAAIGCGPMGTPIIPACSAEQDDFVSCLSP